MLKKVLVAGAVVALALLAAYVVLPNNFANIRALISDKIESVEDSVPPERKIAVLRKKIDNLEKDDAAHVHRVAKLRAEVKESETAVGQFRDNLAVSEKRIRAMDAALKVEGVQVSYESRQWARPELKTTWEQAVDHFRVEEQRLRAMDTELSAKRQTLDVATRNLSEMRLMREQLRADLATLQAELDLERRAQALERNVASDPKAAEARAELTEIRRRINVMKEERNLRRELKGGGGAVRTHEEQKKAQETRDTYYRERFGGGGAVSTTGANNK